MSINIVGVGTTKFGELWDMSPRSLIREAYEKAIVDADIKPKSIDAVFVGNMLSGMLGNQENMGAFVSETVEISSVPAVKVEGACASGGLAIHQGVQAILSGLYKTVLVVGVEKMTDHKPEEVASALMGAGSDEERTAGLTFPGLYGLIAKSHMEKFDTTEKDMVSVSVKNHYHASLNPNAHFQKMITEKQVLDSPCVSDPLKLLDCSPISDGASAVILSSEKNKSKRPVSIVASSTATDSLGLSNRSDLTSLNASKLAGKSAFATAGLSPSDIDVAEVHDCFSIAEIIALEDLGFFKKGALKARTIRSMTLSNTSINKLVVNPSGGLKACGHPVGATGVKQIVEITKQLRGSAGKRQVKNARVGLAHNVGGSGAVAAVHILKS